MTGDPEFRVTFDDVMGDVRCPNCGSIKVVYDAKAWECHICRQSGGMVLVPREHSEELRAVVSAGCFVMWWKRGEGEWRRED